MCSTQNKKKIVVNMLITTHKKEQNSKRKDNKKQITARQDLVPHMIYETFSSIKY